jgi:hypothetical protein
MAKTNAKGKTWRQHAGPFLSTALKQASKSWRPSNQRTNKKKVLQLRKQRERINLQIKKEVEKG